MRAALFLLVLAGCAGVIRTSGISTSSSSSPSSPSSSSGGGGSFSGNIVVRDQLAALIGKTPDDAKKLLDSYGHDGRVMVEPDTKFHEDCGDNRVCALSVPESGMGIHDPITLYTNKTLSISGPPPE